MHKILRLRFHIGRACNFLFAAWCCTAAVHAQTQPELPITKLAAQASPLSTELTALMQDYNHRLVSARALNWLPDPQLADQTSDWSVHATKLMSLCAELTNDCTPLVKSQIETLLAQFNVQREPVDRASAVYFATGISAIADLCALSNLESEDRMKLCHEPLGLVGKGEIARFNKESLTYPGYAALLWDQLGEEELFAAYYQKHILLKNSFDTLLTQLAPTQPWAKDAQNVFLPSADLELAAQEAEISDQIVAARNYRFLALLQQASQLVTNHADFVSTPKMILSAYSLARLSYLLNDAESGQQWQQVAALFIRDFPGTTLPLSCELQQEQARMELAAAAVLHQEANSYVVLQSLIAHNCAYTQYALDASLAELKLDQGRSALSVAQAAQFACRNNHACSSSRLHHLEQAAVIAQGDVAQMKTQAEYWLKESHHGLFNGRERQLIWALALSLEKRAYHAESSQLISALDDQLVVFRNQLENTASDLKNLARYEQLSRLRVRQAVQSGQEIRFADTEAMRAQSVLQKLRLKRWETELRDMQDRAASNKMQASLQAIHQGRDIERSLQTKSLDPALTKEQKIGLSTLANAMQSMLDEQQVITKTVYLNGLARRKMEAMDGQSYQAWFLNFSSFLSKHEQRNEQVGRSSKAQAIWMPSGDGTSFIESASAYLTPGQAYLSWLQVPQGFVATLAAPKHNALTGADSWFQHSLFIACSDNMLETLALYRQLLQSDSASSRSATLVHSVLSDQHGLLLKGVPVWRRADQTFVAASVQPMSAGRATSLKEISESLYALLFAPLTAYLHDTQQLIISPDAELSYLPFETLSYQGRALQQQFTISYVQSLAVHTELMRRAEQSSHNNRRLLSVADPDYRQSDPTDIAWRALPATQLESNQLLQLFPNGLQLLGKAASLRKLNSLDADGQLAQFDILHFATHGIVNDNSSALVLAMSHGVKEGYLHDVDVLAMHLNSSLVILSACNTALGHNVSGEGIVGLPYAFLWAGNSNTLMSLWPVDDKGTAKFMSVFMEKASHGMDLVTALSQTKRDFARGEFGVAFSDPRIWAAFVQYGVDIALY